MKKNLVIASLATIISLAAVFSVSAWQGEKLSSSNNQEIKEELNQAMVHQDYNTWLELKTDRSPCEHGSQITEENFALFSQAHELLREGNTEEAQAIFEQLGKDMPQKQMGREGKFRAEGERPRRGQSLHAPFGNNLRNQ